jgi:2-hydroxychromene-2-carboxylate isomerase
MLVLHHDFTSPASAVAVLRLQRLADEGLNVGFSGVAVVGLDVAIPPTLDLLAELERWQGDAEALGLRMQRPRRQPPTLRAHLVATVADDHDLSSAWRLAVYRAYWEDGADLDDPGTLATLATAHGLPGDAVRAILDDHARLTALRRRMAAKRGEGIGGVPVLELDGALVPATLPDDDLRQLASL